MSLQSKRALLLRLRRDDGAIVYLNGAEIIRSNMPDGPITALTKASSTVGGADQATYFEFAIDPACSSAARTSWSWKSTSRPQAARTWCSTWA